MDQPRMLAAATGTEIVMLGWLRGFAAIIVIVCHVSQATWVSYTGEPTPFTVADLPVALSLFNLGNFAVAMFFVLSGCTLYLAQYRRPHMDVGGFYLRRFARIYPAYLFALLCYLAFRNVFRAYYGEPGGHWVEEQFLQPLTLSELFHYFTLSANWLMGGHLINNAFWSLPVEFQFYLLFPLLLFLHRAAPPWLGILLFCALAHLSILVIDHREAYTFYWLWQFGGGMLCAHAYLQWRRRIGLRLGLLLMALVYLLVWLAVELPAPSFPGVDAGTYQGIGAVVLVFIAVHVDVQATRGWFARFWTWQGTISYGSYLFHNLFVALGLLVALHAGIDGWARFALIGLGTCLCTFAVAHFSYAWLELPWIDYAKRVTQPKQVRGPARAAVSA